MIDYTKIVGAIATLGTIVVTIGTIAIVGSEYRKKIDNIDDLASRISKLEAKLTGTDKILSVEGPKGNDGAPGRQGDPGPRGPQGEKGEKGEPGVSPAQLTNLETRVSMLERRPTSGPSTPTPPISPDPSKERLSGIGINARGCYFLTPDFQAAVVDLGEGDKFCTVDGQASMTIAGILDDRFFFNTANGGGESECRIQANRPSSWCGKAPFNSNVYMAGRGIRFDPNGKRRVSLDLLMR